jgi:hypothetical protein
MGSALVRWKISRRQVKGPIWSGLQVVIRLVRMAAVRPPLFRHGPILSSDGDFPQASPGAVVFDLEVSTLAVAG